MVTSLQPIPEGLIGREAFILFLLTLQPKNGSREIWFKLGHDRFYVGTWSDSGIFELWATKGKSENRRRTYKVSSDAFEFLYQQSLKLDGGVFYVPTQPQGFPLKNCVDSTDDITIEMDGIPLAEQWEKYQTFEAVTGLEFANLLASAGKSIHGRLKLTDHIPVDQAQEIRVLVTLGLISDPAILSLQQPVRVPGFFRKEKNSHQALLKYSFKRYTPDQIRSGLKKWFAYQGWVFPETIPADWFREVLRPILAPTKDKPLTESQKVEQIKAALEKGFEGWQQEKLEKQRREALERQAKELERQSNPLSVVNTRHFEQVTETIREASRRLGSDAFNLFNHNWQWSGDKARGLCIGHDSSTGTAAWMARHASGDGYRYHCPTCTDNKPVTPFDYFVFSRTGSWERPKGAEFFELAAEFCRSAGIELPARGSRQHHDSEYIQSQVEQERVEQAQQGATLLEYIQKKLFRHGKARKTRRLQSGAYTQTSDNAILFEAPEQRLAIIQRLKAKGIKHILDRTATGYGKSYNLALLQPEDLGVTQLFRLSDDHRNPTTSPAEEWEDLPTRHNGLVRDESRQTQSGKVYVTRPKPGEKPDIPGNCINADRFHILNSKGLSPDRKIVEGETGTLLNPICAGCSLVGLCGQGSGNGSGFRYQRARGLSHTRIRGNLESLSASDIQVSAAAILDEAGRHIKPTIQLEADLSDWSRLWMELENKCPNEYQKLGNLRRGLYKPMSQRTETYGLTHLKALEILGTPPEDIHQIIEAVESIVPKPQDLIGEREQFASESMTQQQRTRQKVLEDRVKDFSTTELAYQSLQIKYGAIDVAQKLGQLSEDETKIYRTWHRHYSNGKIEDLRAELQNLNQLKKRIDEQRKALRTAQSALNRHQRREENESINSLPTYWLVPLLRIWAGEPGTIRINCNRLTITLPNIRMQETLQHFEICIYLDTTLKREHLAMAIGVSPDEIAVIEQATEQPKNLKIYQVSGFGLLNTQRSADQNRRVNAAKETLRAKHPDIAIIDWMRCDDRDGYWFRDNRGTNHFESVSAIAAFGTPYSNIGSLQDIRHTLTGEWNEDEVTKWAEWLAVAEVIQAVGRLRAHRRPEEELACYVFSELPLPLEMRAIQLNPSDISPDCCTRGEVTRQALIDAVKLLTEQGIKITQAAVADAIGKARSLVAMLSKEIGGSWKGFLKIVSSLISLSSRETDNFAPNEYEQWIALEHLPAVTKDKPPEDIPKEIQEVISTVGWDSWVKVVAILPHETRIRLLAGVLNLLPRGWLMAQIDLLQVAL